MIEKQLIIADLQEQIKKTDDPKTRAILAEIIGNIFTGKYSVRIW
jgi:hypothetical protein